MPGRLRIFISSTMEDLENERDMVVARLDQSNFEPVNAEAMLPSGATSWDRISDEIDSCHAFLLLSGLRYGWVPTSGPLAAERISVTHGEYRAARALKLPILPFFKVLKYGADSTSDDARLRDGFRKEIGDWDAGQFRTEFTTARDLAEKAVAAVTRMLSDHFERELLAERRSAARPIPVAPTVPLDPGQLPASLLAAVRERRATFWAGSGISLRAGLPTSEALAAEMARSIRASLADYRLPAVGSGIASIASDFESILSRQLLLAKLEELLDLPGGVPPTPEHAAAVQLFPTIITTNYDRLFEEAAKAAASGHKVIAGPRLPSPAPGKVIWKIHGAWNWPDLLVVSEADIARFEDSSPQLIEQLGKLLSGAPLLVGGTTLRDPSVHRLTRALQGSIEGYWCVSPGDAIAIRRAKDLGMVPIEAQLESLMAALLKACAVATE